MTVDRLTDDSLTARQVIGYQDPHDDAMRSPKVKVRSNDFLIDKLLSARARLMHFLLGLMIVIVNALRKHKFAMPEFSTFYFHILKKNIGRIIKACHQILHKIRLLLETKKSYSLLQY